MSSARSALGMPRVSGAFSCSSAAPILDSPGTGAFLDRSPRAPVPCQVANSSWVFLVLAGEHVGDVGDLAQRGGVDAVGGVHVTERVDDRTMPRIAKHCSSNAPLSCYEMEVDRSLVPIPSSYHRHRNVRAWLLKQHHPVPGIRSLPPESFMPIGHAGKATVLLLEKRRPKDEQEHVLVADVQAVCDDRFGRPTREKQLPQLIELINRFQEGGNSNLQYE